MRILGLTLIALFVALPAVRAQDAKSAPTGASAMSEKNRKYLDAYLDAWEKRMKSIRALETKIVLTEIEASALRARKSRTRLRAKRRC